MKQTKIIKKLRKMRKGYMQRAKAIEADVANSQTSIRLSGVVEGLEAAIDCIVAEGEKEKRRKNHSASSVTPGKIRL